MSFLRRSNQSLIQSIRQLTITVSQKIPPPRGKPHFTAVNLTGHLECCTDESWECRPNCRSRWRTKYRPGKYPLLFSTFFIPFLKFIHIYHLPHESSNIRQWVDSALWMFYTGVTLTRQHILTAIQPENLSWVIYYDVIYYYVTNCYVLYKYVMNYVIFRQHKKQQTEAKLHDHWSLILKLWSMSIQNVWLEIIKGTAIFT